MVRFVLGTSWLLAALASISMHEGVCGADAAAYMNGIAAVITAISLLVDRAQTTAAVQDHETRIKVLESA